MAQHRGGSEILVVIQLGIWIQDWIGLSDSILLLDGGDFHRMLSAGNVKN